VKTNNCIRGKSEKRTGLLCHAVRVQKENVNTRRSREKRRKKGGTRGAKKRLLQESLTSREPRREKQKADPVAKRKAPDEDGGSSRSGVASVEDLNRRPQRGKAATTTGTSERASAVTSRRGRGETLRKQSQSETLRYSATSARKDPREIVRSCMSAVQRTRRKRKDLDLESLRSLWPSV
jgi:hypothetical protein